MTLMSDGASSGVSCSYRLLTARGACGVLVAALLVCGLAGVPCAADDGDTEYVVVKARRVITVSGEEFSPGTVVIEDGKVSLVGGPTIEYPKSAKVIQAGRQTVMPGFVLPRTRYQLGGYSRSGVNGDQNAASEIYLSQMDFDDLLEAGYTTVCFVPNGKDIPGKACAFRTAGPEDARRIGDETYLDVATRWDAGSKGKQVLRDALKKAKEEIEKVEKAQKEWDEKQQAKEEEAKKKEAEEEKPEGGDEPEPKPEPKPDPKKRSGDEPEGEGDKPKEGEKDSGEKPKEEKFEPPKIDPKHQPLVDLIQKKDGASMMIRLGTASDLLHLDDVLEAYDDLAYTLFLSEWTYYTNFEPVVASLGEREAKVALKPSVNRLPNTASRYNLIAKLAAAGVEVSALPWNDSRGEYLRVRSRLAESVRAGLDADAALKAITLYPANIIGLGDRLGSLEKDKDADMVFLDGDPLDPHTKVKRVMVLGEIVWTADKKK